MKFRKVLFMFGCLALVVAIAACGPAPTPGLDDSGVPTRTATAVKTHTPTLAPKPAIQPPAITPVPTRVGPVAGATKALPARLTYEWANVFDRTTSAGVTTGSLWGDYDEVDTGQKPYCVVPPGYTERGCILTRVRRGGNPDPAYHDVQLPRCTQGSVYAPTPLPNPPMTAKEATVVSFHGLYLCEDVNSTINVINRTGTRFLWEQTGQTCPTETWENGLGPFKLLVCIIIGQPVKIPWPMPTPLPVPSRPKGQLG